MENINMTKNGKIKIRELTKDQAVVYAVLASLAVISVIGFFFIDTKNIKIMTAFGSFFQDFRKMFLQPQTTLESVPESLYEILITLGLSFITTIIGAVIALILGLLGAKNLTNPAAAQIIKKFVAFVRAVPTVLWVLIFAIGAGLGSVAAVVGMTFHTIGYLIKAFSESFEEIDGGVLEALKASGANWIQIVFQAIIPSSASYIVSWTFVRFEVNFAVAVTMGAAAGAGGIGFDLFMASSFYFNIHRVGYLTYLILGVALLLELLSLFLKRKLIKSGSSGTL